ncbi:MAG TPA: hypothetical protein DHU16_00180 [Gammaproteobacteria bacterium]|nr:hypothetical protein [Gammaproteobacteria bacterium]
MKFTRRLGETQAATQYPLQIHNHAQWQALGSDLWQTQIDLGDLPTGQIIIPSFALIGSEHRYQFLLLHSGGSNILRALPAATDPNTLFTDHSENSHMVSDHIDCWHSHTTITAARLLLRVECKTQPRNYLCVVSTRPLEIRSEATSVRSVALEKPPAISQMTATEDIRNRICSPTALAMALAYLGKLHDMEHHSKLWSELTTGCYDPVTKAYGMWPQAIYQASRLNCLAAVECNTDWSGIEHALIRQTPVICSIRFERGELKGAPLDRTAGHLLLVYGINEESVLVMDPAAVDTTSVARVYDRQQFSAAWLRHRGAAYYFGQPTTHR